MGKSEYQSRKNIISYVENSEMPKMTFYTQSPKYKKFMQKDKRTLVLLASAYGYKNITRLKKHQLAIILTIG